MHYSTATRLHTHSVTQAWTVRLHGMATALFAAWAEHRRRRRAWRAMAQLSDRTLADLGVTRAELSSIAHLGPRDRSRRRPSR